jgi:hypothetical protein
VDAAGFGIRRRFRAYYGRPNARLARDPSFKTVSALMDVQPPDSPRGLPHPAAGSRCRRAPGWDGTKRGGLFPGSGGGRGTMQKIYACAGRDTAADRSYPPATDRCKLTNSSDLPKIRFSLVMQTTRAFICRSLGALANPARHLHRSGCGSGNQGTSWGPSFYHEMCRAEIHWIAVPVSPVHRC